MKTKGKVGKKTTVLKSEVKSLRFTHDTEMFYYLFPVIALILPDFEAFSYAREGKWIPLIVDISIKALLGALALYLIKNRYKNIRKFYKYRFAIRFLVLCGFNSIICAILGVILNIGINSQLLCGF